MSQISVHIFVTSAHLGVYTTDVQARNIGILLYVTMHIVTLGITVDFISKAESRGPLTLRLLMSYMYIWSTHS